jgi:acyl dehydratase
MSQTRSQKSSSEKHVLQTPVRIDAIHHTRRVMHYFEDLAVGQLFGTKSLTVSAAEIKAFARQFDAQPFHLDEQEAKGSFFGELVASGWHVAALTMKLLLEGEYQPAGGLIGARADELAWPNPTRPGDTLTCTAEILELRPSSTRLDRGSVKLRATTVNASGHPVYVLVMNGIAKRRPTGS